MTLVLDDFGVDLEASGAIALGDLMSAYTNAVRSRARSVWQIGDIYNLGSAYEEFSQVLDASGVSLKTQQNYSTLCNAWPKQMRKIPVAPSYYEAVTALLKTQPDLALHLLEQAYDARPKDMRSWLRDEAAKAMGHYCESADLLLVYDGVNFVPSGVPSWLEVGFTISKTVRKA